jgi:plasmid stability protein
LVASITIRNLDDDAKERLRVRAAANGRSMEAEARALIEKGVSSPYAGINIGQAFRAAAAEIGYMDDLVIPERAGARIPMDAGSLPRLCLRSEPASN